MPRSAETQRSDDLDEDKITRFLVLARRGRNFPLPGDTPPHEVLVHLNLLDKGRPTHAAILLFGKQPQRFLITSEVKCAHFHGYEVAKPIPSYQVYKGTVFDLVDQAKDFVLSKIDLWVGTQSGKHPGADEIRNSAGSCRRSHRQCRRASRLHQQCQRTGHAL